MGCFLRAAGANRKPVLLLHSGRVHPKPFSSKSTPHLRLHRRLPIERTRYAVARRGPEDR
jgi:hypothetical protein